MARRKQPDPAPVGAPQDIPYLRDTGGGGGTDNMGPLPGAPMMPQQNVLAQTGLQGTPPPADIGDVTTPIDAGDTSNLTTGDLAALDQGAIPPEDPTDLQSQNILDALSAGDQGDPQAQAQAEAAMALAARRRLAGL